MPRSRTSTSSLRQDCFKKSPSRRIRGLESTRGYRQDLLFPRSTVSHDVLPASQAKTEDVLFGQPETDPMIAKVIAYGDTREEARSRLDQALSETVLLGTATNVEYLRSILNCQSTSSARRVRQDPLSDHIPIPVLQNSSKAKSQLRTSTSSTSTNQLVSKSSMVV
jgi:hypothetical protein